ncbi:RUN and FYVE domain-containing protein 4 isoform X1 [Moschus berezovskii]|uniref:RUN and FYVE domain-containing protein 4 isoform X1 n=1 Tax=Moschus berezovskii TaxID=68408 RepID=UPI0024439B2D|nr:RUN and FYVE domain-containing protein 4 isoform X1 [Moschus berezovskii]XP_055253216.1 RUN and FYVE domain-containing protein 4 isoform X1 [Moschus berezovskii]XP_055253217.1 RUN and FYVE domain-containing protein 4 isoform X1 [Moschus berezovskii]
MAEEGTVLKMTRDLKAAVSAILQGYGTGRQPVTDASAELHRLCGCLELLLQFDQKEQKSFLRPRKDYWDFLCAALWQQRGDTEPVRFVHSLDKLKTPLGKGRAFIRFCLAHGQLAESLQLCLLNPDLTREWYGPRSPLVCPELQEDILDSLYALNGMTFDLDLQRPDLDGAWPLFSESHCSNSSWTRGRRPRKTKDSPKEISATYGNSTEVYLEEPHTSQASCLRDAPRKDGLAKLPRSQQHRHHPHLLEKKKEDPRSLGSPLSLWELDGEEFQQDQEKGAPRTGICLEDSTPTIQGQREGARETLKEVIGSEAEGKEALLGVEGQGATEGTHEGEAERSHIHRLLASSPKGTIGEAVSWGKQDGKVPSIPGELWVLHGLGTKEDSTSEKPQEQTGVTSVTRREEQAEMALQDIIKSLRHGLQKTQEQAQHQEQLLKEQEGELKALQEQLSRCQEERARLQAELEQKQREAERKDAVYEEELGGQQDLVRAMKSRVLELIQEKDVLWHKVQHLSSVAPGCCVVCSKIFGRLSRRYPCRRCGGLVCHACSVDYKKRERHCPPCSQRRDTQVL